MGKSWKNENINMEIHDIIYYGSGYLGIIKFQARGTTWYAPLPLERSAIDANLKGQKMLKK